MATRYWTAFMFADQSLEGLHCTHKYLGELHDEKLEKLLSDLLDYFDRKPFEYFAANFDLHARFGPKGDIPVHKASMTGAFQRYSDLRETLDQYRKDDWPFTPHVTSPEPSIGVFDRYVLMKDEEVLFEWRA